MKQIKKAFAALLSSYYALEAIKPENVSAVLSEGQLLELAKTVESIKKLSSTLDQYIMDNVTATDISKKLNDAIVSAKKTLRSAVEP